MKKNILTGFLLGVLFFCVMGKVQAMQTLRTIDGLPRSCIAGMMRHLDCMIKETMGNGQKKLFTTYDEVIATIQEDETALEQQIAATQALVYTLKAKRINQKQKDAFEKGSKTILVLCGVINFYSTGQMSKDVSGEDDSEFDADVPLNEYERRMAMLERGILGCLKDWIFGRRL